MVSCQIHYYPDLSFRILAPLRNETFFTLAALNARIAALLTNLNDRPMKGYGGASRRALFERLDRPGLQPLPRDRYVQADWRHARVNIDYHVEVDRHYYSVPHALIHTAAEVRVAATTVDVAAARRTRVAPRAQLSARSPHDHPGPHAEGAPRASGLEPLPFDRLGRHTEALVQALLESRPHPEQGYRSCLGILRLAKQHGPARLDAACASRGRIATSSPSSNTAWTVCLWTPSRRHPPGRCMPTSVGPPITNSLTPKETARG